MTFLNPDEHAALLRETATHGFYAAAMKSGRDPIALLRERHHDPRFDADVRLAEELLRLRLESVLIEVATNPDAPLRERVAISKQLVKAKPRAVEQPVETSGATAILAVPSAASAPPPTADAAVALTPVEEPVEDEPLVTRPIRRTQPRIGRNEPCRCGSGRKSKQCCGGMNSVHARDG